MNELVSVIIPTYKGEDKINRAVDSVLSQTYHNVEVIVVDDNGEGTDHQIKTAEAMSRYCQNDKVKYIVQDINRNGAVARNTGIKAASGEYLCFLDDDDVFTPIKIEKQLEKFRTLDASYGMVFGSVKEIFLSGSEKYHSAKFGGDFLYKFLCDDINACSSTVMIRSSVMDTVIEWDESFKRHQDWEFFARVADAFKVCYVEDICIEKFAYQNNLPKDGKITEEYRLKYLDKVSYIIDKYTEKQQKNIYDHHYTDNGKVYIKNKDLKNAFRLAFKTSNVLKTCYIYFKDGLKYLKKK